MRLAFFLTISAIAISTSSEASDGTDTFIPTLSTKQSVDESRCEKVSYIDGAQLCRPSSSERFSPEEVIEKENDRGLLELDTSQEVFGF